MNLLRRRLYDGLRSLLDVTGQILTYLVWTGVCNTLLTTYMS